MNPFEPFSVCLDVTIRPCRREDLPTLEWFGLFAPERDLIDSTFSQHERGEAVMLVADANGVASGQIWIDLGRRDVDSTGVLWAGRVFPSLQNLGIGSRLLAAGEQVLRQGGFDRAELAVEKDNPGARRLYERLGYELVDEAGSQWILRKPLSDQAEKEIGSERVDEEAT